MVEWLWREPARITGKGAHLFQIEVPLIFVLLKMVQGSDTFLLRYFKDFKDQHLVHTGWLRTILVLASQKKESILHQ